MASIAPVWPVATAPSGPSVESTKRAPVSPAKRREGPDGAAAERTTTRSAGTAVSRRPGAVAAADSQRSAINTARMAPAAKKEAVVPQVLVERFGKAVVRIESQKDGNTTGIGTGFIVSSAGFILTNYHVIDSPDGATSLTIGLSTGEHVPVRSVVATDPDRDLAVLSINGKNLPTIPLGNLDVVRPGEEIVVLGSPEGPSNGVSTGVVSGIRDLTDGTQLVEITAQVAPGNSGGPVFGAGGQVVGIVVLKIQGQETPGVCIPVRDLIPIVQGLPHVKAG